MTIEHRDPLGEARAALTIGSYEPLVIEPALPADLDPDFYADDPTNPVGVTGSIVSPVAGVGHTTWSDPSHTETREALHQVAFFAIGPKRHAVNGKIGLRYTHHGFGTPFFGDDEQVRVEGDQLIHQTADDVKSTRITTVREAAEFLGVPYVVEWFPSFHDPLDPVDPDTALSVDGNASRAIGDWFGFATSVLEELRRTDGAVDVSRVQLWPEHFDPAMEIGSADSGQRASYGASPGDGSSAEPYLYVAPWSGVPDESDSYWNAEGFGGALLSYSDLLGAGDQRQTALEFLRAGLTKLSG